MPRHTTLRWSGFSLLAVLVLAAPARSQEDRASVLFREGREAAKKGDFAGACPKFQESFAAAAKVGTLFNLADCRERTGKLSLALQTYQRVLGMLVSGDERLVVTETRIADLDKRVSRLTISGKLPKDAVVRRDGEDLPANQLGLAFPIDAGGHVVLVVRAGQPDRRFEVVLREGERRELDVTEPPVKEPEPVAVPPAPRPAASPSTAVVKPPATLPSNTDTLTAGYVVGGVGIAGLLVSGVTGFMALSKKSAMKTHCNASVQCDQEGLDAASSGKTLSTISTVGFGVGVLGVGLGAYFLFTSNDRAMAAGVAPTTGGATLRLARTF